MNLMLGLNKLGGLIMIDNIINKECRFAVHFPSELTGGEDLHLVKEQVHMPDGTIQPNLRFIQNYERHFYITKKAFRTHTQKKEWAPLTELISYTTTQSKLRDSVAKAIGKGFSKDNLRRLSSNPYLYGSDISSTALIKREYMLANPTKQSKNTVATFDIEFDVISGKDQITMITVAFGSYIFTGILESFVSGINNVESRIDASMNKYLKHYIDKRKIQTSTVIYSTEEELVRGAFLELHRLKPDIVAIWNMNYDIPKVIDACGRAKMDPKEIFSDPSIPKELQFFNYRQGKAKKVSASGVVKSTAPVDQWHSVECPASFYIIDAMCAFKRIRLGEPDKPSYALNSILDLILGIRKLTFTETDQYSGLRWHQVMQSDFKIEYIVYNRFDCISMQELDEKTHDLTVALPMLAGCSDYSRFDSQPSLLVDKLYFEVLEQHQSILAAAGGELATPADEETASLSNWICMLPAHTVTDTGLALVKERPNLPTSIRKFVHDLDVTGAYPNGGIVFNISRASTRRELVSIAGIPEDIYRLQNINLSSGAVNAIEYCTVMFNYPPMESLLELYQKENVA